MTTMSPKVGCGTSSVSMKETMLDRELLVDGLWARRNRCITVERRL